MACDLELDKMIGIVDNHKWLWFRKYCHAARVAKSLIHRNPLPMGFCQEVRKKLLDTNAELTEEFYEYENTSVFKKEHDEQLLIWLNRYILNKNTKFFTIMIFLGDRRIGLYLGVVLVQYTVGDIIIEGS